VECFPITADRVEKPVFKGCMEPAGDNQSAEGRTSKYMGLTARPLGLKADGCCVRERERCFVSRNCSLHHSSCTLQAIS
jgi:hypothetical protein